MLAISGSLLNHRSQNDNGIRIWFTGKDPELQAKLKTLVAYSYGTESGVGNDSPNPWGMRLTILRSFAAIGILVAGVFAGLTTAHWINAALGIIGTLAGGILTLVATFGVLDWMNWRSIPKEILESKIDDVLLKTTLVYYGDSFPEDLTVLTGHNAWRAISAGEPEWPLVRANALTLSAGELATIVAPPEMGETSGVMARDAIQEIPAPPPSQPLLDATFKVGVSVAEDLSIGIDPDAHGLATGGSRSGKTSIAYAMLTQLVERGDGAPGIFLVDPHLSLSDSLLQFIHELPAEQRAKAIQRLRIISPDQPEVIPLNLLALDDFSWAGNSIVQIGRRIWDDYWGPRMQAALLALFRLAHAWNKYNKEKMGLLHVVFSAFNVRWRHAAMGFLAPADRLGMLALDALLGQFGEDGGKNQGWVTEVVSPILSKVMALELSPWLFAAMHQGSFVDLERWVNERAWVIMRLPMGEMGRESARLTASVVYNVFDAAFRKVTGAKPIPFYFFIDEAQEIGTGMRLESMLSEGAKFGARMFVLTQSLAMMRGMDGMEALVQSLLANTSTQAFFSPDPEDADTIRAILSSSHRYGDITLDLPTLHCWLRARVEGHWQPPTLAKIEPLRKSNRADVQAIIREVIQAHAEDYVFAADWEEGAMGAIEKMIAPGSRLLLEEALNPDLARRDVEKLVSDAAQEEKRQKIAQIEKTKAVERGEDPALVRLEEPTRKREGTVDEDTARLGL
ncbi:MAG TPA: type IV secretory system conjugative DNA transfer family protein [Anaerolineales bacterium]|nr:type IV secretory system conjugative DNA transfer family protein [Anaerolineales bacterium]